MSLLEQLFPGLRAAPYLVTSPRTREYNCIAWAAGDGVRRVAGTILGKTVPVTRPAARTAEPRPAARHREAALMLLDSVKRSGGLARQPRCGFAVGQRLQELDGLACSDLLERFQGAQLTQVVRRGVRLGEQRR